MVRLAGVEPATVGLEVRCSIQLSYRRMRTYRTLRGFYRAFGRAWDGGSSAISLLCPPMPLGTVCDRAAPGPPLMTAIRIVIVDDHQVFRQGLRRVLEAEPDMEVVGEARTGAEAVELAATTKPDVMLLDVRLEDIDGPTVCERVQGVAPKTAIVMLSGYLQDRLILRSLVA